MTATGAARNGTVRVVVVGDTNTGKTALSAMICGEDGRAAAAARTVACNTFVKSVRGGDVRVELLDVGGASEYRISRSAFYRNLHGVILVYDVSNRKSWASLSNWVRDLAIADEACQCGIMDRRSGGVMGIFQETDSRTSRSSLSLPAIASGISSAELDSKIRLLLQKLPVIVVGNKADLVAAQQQTHTPHHPPYGIPHGPVISSISNSNSERLDDWFAQVHERHFSFGNL